MKPRFRSKPSNPFNRQVLGVVVRRAESGPKHLKLTEPRVKLMQAIASGEVKAGHGQYTNHWRWSGLTVTNRVRQLVDAGWAQAVSKHVELTDAGRAVLPKDGAP